MNRTETFEIIIRTENRSFKSVLNAKWDGNICLSSDVEGDPYPDAEVMDLIIYAILEGNILEDTLFVCSQGLTWQDTYDEHCGIVKRVLKFNAVLT